MKLMIFTIFWNFFGIFLNLFKCIFDFKMIKKILKGQKRGYFLAQDSHGCDVARKATRQSHASPCGRLHGTKVTRVCAIYIYIY